MSVHTAMIPEWRRRLARPLRPLALQGQKQGAFLAKWGSN
jgi:hypothetical protein